MSLINSKVGLSLAWVEKLSNAGTTATFNITDPKLHVRVVILLTEDNVKLSK